MADDLRALWAPYDDGWHDVTMGTYLAWPFLSASRIKRLHERTPRYVLWSMLNHEDNASSASQSLGSLTHAAVFEPGTLEDHYAPEPEPDPHRHTTKSGKPSSNPRATAAFQDEVAALEEDGKQVVTREQWAAALDMRDAIHSHKRARQLVQAPGPVERSAITTDPTTGVRCKIRPDKLIPDLGYDVNLKTTKNATRESFGRDVYYYHYHWSAAFYRRCFRWLGWECRRSLLIIVESDGPKQVAVRELDAGTLDVGDQWVGHYLDDLAQYLEAGTWPGFADEIRSQSLPHWAWRRSDEELEMARHG